MQIKHIYVDDSGNPKNTKSCIICFLVFENTDILNDLSIEIEVLKIKRFKYIHTELHFNKESFATKRLFFKILNKYEFKIYYYQTMVICPRIKTLSQD